MNTNSQLAGACVLAMIEQSEESAYAALPEPVFSMAFRRKIRRFTSLSRGNRYHCLTRTAKVLLTAAVIALLLLVTAAAAKQYGYRLINNGTNGHLEIEKQTNAVMHDLVCEYIPEGFVLTETSYKPGVVYNGFTDPNLHFLNIQKLSVYDTVSFNTEGRTVYEKNENGIEYTVLISNNNSTVTWIDPQTGILYIVNGNLDVETVFNVAIHCE